MATWLIITLSVYALIVIGFTIAIVLEARKHETKLRVIHIAVAVFWPLWLIWYGFVLIKERKK